MKALTIKQPYADAILSGLKPYEIRSRRTTYRDEFVIHTSAQFTRNAGVLEYYAEDELLSLRPLPLGAGLGVAKITDVLPMTELFKTFDMEQKILCPPLGLWAWKVEVIEVWQKPVPAKGKLGFWNWSAK